MLECTAQPHDAVLAAAFLVVDGDSVIAQTTSAASAMARATHQLRALIEQDRFGTVKVIGPRGQVLWRESAIC